MDQECLVVNRFSFAITSKTLFFNLLSDKKVKFQIDPALCVTYLGRHEVKQSHGVRCSLFPQAYYRMGYLIRKKYIFPLIVEKFSPFYLLH